MQCFTSARALPMMLAGVLLTLAGPVAAKSPTLEMRLERIVTELEAQCVQHHVPGLAIAIVKDDKIVLARGIGLADVEANRPATADTLFAVGSTTKAVTAAIIGMLVDDGKMSWDDPVRTHLPQFRLADEEANEQVVIRDLLSHRTGLASMTLLWYSNRITRDDLIETLGQAELLYPFRSKFNYQNLCFLAAGEASARAAGTTWEALVAERIFTPLGMTNANTSLEVTLADPAMAKGYMWDKDAGELIHQPMRDVGAVGPAGAINASVNDMAQWVRLQLGAGVFEKTRLLSAEQHAQTWTEHTDVGGGIGYGLGWFLRTRGEQRVIEHAGGIDGFTAEVAMIPEENVGFVCLMNLFGSPVQETSRAIVFNALLDDWSDETDTAPAEDFDRFLGMYIANFGPFKDAEFEVSVLNGNLAIDVPGQMNFELGPPDADGKRTFAITDQIAVRFNESDDGAVQSATMYQAGYTFDLPKKGVAIADEVDRAAVQPYLGSFHSTELGRDVKVVIANGRLAVDVPGQMVFELHPPDDEGRWVFRIKDSIWVEFNDDDDGTVPSITMTQEGHASELPRTGGPEEAADALPSVAALMDRMHEANVLTEAVPDTLRATGDMRLVHMGVTGRNTTTSAAGRRLRAEIDLGKYGTLRTLTDGERGWLDMGVLPDPEVDGVQLDQIYLESPLAWLRDWRESFDEVRVVERTTFDDTAVYAVSVTYGEVPPVTVMVDVESGRPVGKVTSYVNPLGMPIEMTTRMSDYRLVGSVMLPHRVEMENALSGRVEITWDEVEFDVPVEAGMFEYAD